jgi:hypothetical protein
MHHELRPHEREPCHAMEQVMLRGAQVALGEVESVLEELPGVEQAVALVQEDPTGVQRLVAYVTPCSLSAAALMAGLRGKLPARMRPCTITPLAEVQATLLLGNPQQCPGDTGCNPAFSDVHSLCFLAYTSLACATED